MPNEVQNHLDPVPMPIHLQYNFFARSVIPLHNPENSKEMEEGLQYHVANQKLDTPSHVVLNHANCWQEAQSNCYGLSQVALTQRLSKSKFMTLIYYKSIEVQAKLLNGGSI